MSAPRQNHPARPTLKDVAAHAGVSVSTASLVFSGKGPVAEATAERVRASARSLGYAGPDPLAASLRQGRAGVIGVAVDAPLRTAFQDPYAAAVLDGISTVLDEVGSGLLLVSGPVPARQALDAMIFPLCGPADPEVVERLRARGTPMVSTGSPSGPGIVRLSVDESGLTAQITRLLVELGHERLGHVTMPLVHPGGVTHRIDAGDLPRADYPDTRARAEGFLSVAPEAPMVTAAEVGIAAGAEAAGILLELEPRPTAIVAQSDLLAAGTIRAAEERGLRVPDDLSVVGFDGIEIPWLQGQLTTIDQSGQAKGRTMGRMALDLIEGKRVRSRQHPARLVKGTTVSAPRRR